MSSTKTPPSAPSPSSAPTPSAPPSASAPSGAAASSSPPSASPTPASISSTLANGKWNLESILLHAAHIDAAPTAQKNAGPAPRFPYIEATGARLNLKLDHEKTPFSLTDADFALWLPDPQQWHLRLQARPARTDTNVSDTGTFQLEGTLGRAASLGQVPISLRGEWRNVPLGQASLVLFGRDAGLRGDMTLSANAQGTVSNSAVQTRLQLTGARRADFVPAQPLDVDLQCLGTATGDFHSFQEIHCSWPPAGSSDPPILAISGALPDIRNPGSAAIEIGTPGLPAATLLDWLRVASSRVPADIAASGTLTGTLSYRPAQPAPPPGRAKCSSPTPASSIPTPAQPRWSPATSPSNPSLTPPPIPVTNTTNATLPPSGFQLAPTTLALGGKDPATLDGHFDTTGYTLHLTGWPPSPASRPSPQPSLNSATASPKSCPPTAPPAPSASTSPPPAPGPTPNLDRQYPRPALTRPNTPTATKNCNGFCGIAH